ncbi:hypothetical protein [Raineyella sp. W15-4]|uniref:hypothetical protein n=1 Tax=Raineyella sp. W15-4 TaxID=3081651 RepID=UPI002954E105|nr:hypothetical protein [Raineyella sp. W15-4]WOQ17865.1 hypothetical protein R0145_03920 [Raineyella sp. W15-4]
MAISKKENQVIQQVIKTHGPTLDLATHPDTLVEIVRKWGFDLLEDVPDGGSLPGGVGPVGPVGPTSLEEGPGLADVLREVLSLQRQVDKINRRLEG